MAIKRYYLNGNTKTWRLEGDTLRVTNCIDRPGYPAEETTHTFRFRSEAAARTAFDGLTPYSCSGPSAAEPCCNSDWQDLL